MPARDPIVIDVHESYRTVMPRPLNRQTIGEWLKRFWAILLLCGLGLSVSWSNAILHGHEMSPIDEWVYLDYLYKVPTELVVRKGSIIGLEARIQMSCEGNVPYGKQGPLCGSDYEFQSYPFGGITAVDPYTPIFFWTTWVTAFPLLALGIDQVFAFRASMALWLIAGLCVMFLLFRKFKVPDEITFTAGLIFLAAPYSYWTYSYVSTDAPMFFFGGLLMYLSVLAIENRISGVWIIPVALVAVLFKIIAVLGLLIIAIYAMSVLYRDRPREGIGSNLRLKNNSPLKLLIYTIGATVLAASAELMWLKIVSSNAISNLSSEQGVASTLTLQGLMKLATYFIPGGLESSVSFPVHLQIIDSVPYPSTISTWIGWLVIAGVIGGFLYIRTDHILRPVIVTSLFTGLLIGPSIALLLKYGSGTYFQVPTRYGAVSFIVLLLSTTWLLRNRTSRILLITISSILICVQPLASHFVNIRL